MKKKRLILALKSFSRTPELMRCLLRSKRPISVVLGYLQFVRLTYPFTVELRSGQKVSAADWEDLTTAWVVLFGNEYVLKRSDLTIIDLGANIGVFTIMAALALPDARVLAVEPFPRNHQRLLEALEANGIAGRVQVLQKAATGDLRRVLMNDADSIPGHSRKIGADCGIEVEGWTLEKICSEAGFETVDFLKVDIEGAEYELFEKTPERVLKRVSRIGFEYHKSGNRDELFRRLTDAGFTQSRHLKSGVSGVAEFVRIS